MRILLAEDEKRMAAALVALLKQEKYDVDHMADGSSALTALESGVYDIAVLDVMMPEMNGFDVARNARRNGVKTPILMLTAKSQLDDKVEGLDSGADDYLAKPFGVMELLSRIRALQRRTAASDEGETLRSGGITLSTARHCVTVHENEIGLTGKEFDLLAMLMRNQGIVLSRERILESVWGYGYAGESRTVDVHIRTLRAKLGDAGNAVETVRGVGYRFQENYPDPTEATE